MEDKEYITKEFLEGNLFEHAKIGAGDIFPWYYEDKRYTVIITLSGVGERIPIVYIENKETNRSMEYCRRRVGEPKKLRKEELKKCIEFLGVPDEFDYDI